MCLPISPSESSENNLIGSETFALCKRKKAHVHSNRILGLDRNKDLNST